jgi:hypothetical protein
MNIILLSLTFLLSCTGENKKVANSVEPPSHALWTDLLQKHVQSDGLVNYRGFQEDSVQLKMYLNALKNSCPEEGSWSQEEQLAFWINAYNAYTIDLIIRYYPVESIKDIGSSIQIPFINTPWDIKFIEICGEKLDLNNIEHSILRKQFDEPRIHFAINCASISCPKLRNEAYTPDQLERQLQEQAVEFINDPTRNIIDTDESKISKIFKWFKGDFTKDGSIIEYLNQYTEKQIQRKANIRYLEYNWKLNEYPKGPM